MDRQPAKSFHIAVIGSSPAGIFAVERIRQWKPQARATVFISDPKSLPYNRRVMLNSLGVPGHNGQIYCRTAKALEGEQIEVSTQKLSRVNLLRKRIMTEERQPIEFDLLILTGPDQYRFPEQIKGTHKAGVFCLRRLSDISAAQSAMLLSDTVVVQMEGINTLRFAVSASRCKKETIVLQGKAPLLSRWVDEDVSRFLQGILAEEGIRFIENETISEILGDSEVKAVRLESGKVIGAQLVVIDDVKPEFRILKDTELLVGSAIGVNARFQTNLTHVFAVDHAAASGPVEDPALFDDYEAYCRYQAECIDACLKNEVIEPFNRFRMISFHLGGHSVILIGQTKAQADGYAFYCRNEEKKELQKFMIQNNRLVGCVLINSDRLKAAGAQLVMAGKEMAEPAASIEERLVEALNSCAEETLTI